MSFVLGPTGKAQKQSRTLVHGTAGRYAPDMIGRLTGIVSDKSTEGVLLDVGGVGYDVLLPLNTLAGLPKAGEETTLHIHTYVREDDLRLYGFESLRDRLAFRTMLKVSGVGPKLALAVIGALSGEQLAQVLRDSDVKRLSAIPGIGKKTAERLILELAGKLKTDPRESAEEEAFGVMADLGSALKNLGFKPAQIDRVLGEINSQGAKGQPFEALLRKALSLLQER